MVHWYALVGDCVSRAFFFLNPSKPYASVTTGRNTKALFSPECPSYEPDHRRKHGSSEPDHHHHNHMPRRRCITTFTTAMPLPHATQRHISFHYNCCFPVSVRSMRIRDTCKTPSLPPLSSPPWICFSQVQRNLISLDLDWTGFEAPQTPADAHDARPLPPQTPAGAGPVSRCGAQGLREPGGAGCPKTHESARLIPSDSFNQMAPLVRRPLGIPCYMG